MRRRAADALVFAFHLLESFYIQFNSKSKGGRIKCELFSLNIFLYIEFSVSKRTRMTNCEICEIHFQQHFYTSLMLKLMMSYMYYKYFFRSGQNVLVGMYIMHHFLSLNCGSGCSLCEE